MHVRLFVVLISLSCAVACDAGDDAPTLERVVADHSDAVSEARDADCESTCAAASEIDTCDEIEESAEESPCAMDALRLSPEASQDTIDCWRQVEHDYADCVLAPSCTEAGQWSACGEARAAGFDACGDLPLDVENALELCEAED